MAGAPDPYRRRLTRAGRGRRVGDMTVLEQQIRQALADNPRVPADTISVQAFGGDVTLRGTVGSVVQREEAVRTARHVSGVGSVTGRLPRRLRAAPRPAAADPAAAVPAPQNGARAGRPADIDVAVRDGAATLSGLVD